MIFFFVFSKTRVHAYNEYMNVCPWCAFFVLFFLMLYVGDSLNKKYPLYIGSLLVFSSWRFEKNICCGREERKERMRRRSFPLSVSNLSFHSVWFDFTFQYIVYAGSVDAFLSSCMLFFLAICFFFFFWFIVVNEARQRWWVEEYDC